jgi:hypothetical protein
MIIADASSALVLSRQAVPVRTTSAVHSANDWSMLISDDLDVFAITTHLRRKWRTRQDETANSYVIEIAL